MTKDEMKDRISMALKDPILQQRFIDNLISLEKENAELKARLNAINLLTSELEKSSKLKKQQLTKARHLIRRYVKIYVNPYPEEEIELRNEAEQFLKEVSE